MADGLGLSLSCLSWSVSDPFGLSLLLCATLVYPAGSQDSGLGRQTGRAGQPGWEGQCLGFPGALQAPVAGHRKLLVPLHHISFYDPVSTWELKSRLQLALHAASKQSQAFLSPRFHPYGDLCLECSSLIWSAPQLPSVQFLSHLRDTSKCPLKPQALPSAP